MSHEGGIFSGDLDNVFTWISYAGVILGVLTAGVILSVLFRKPADRVTPAAKWALFVGLLAFPATTMLAANATGFHQASKSCASCHTMDPWINDMIDPKSETLAAKHYRNRWINEDQCYKCHSGYGFGGNIESKISALGHVTHYYITGVPEEIRIKKPVSHQRCLGCHEEAASFLAVDQHVDPEFAPKILNGEMSCFECHEAPHPREKKP